MTTSGSAPLPAPSILTRVTQIALLLNAVMATIAAAGFAAGTLPHAAAQPIMARRAAAGELAGALIFVLVARRLRVDSVYELVVSGDRSDLAPLVVEGIFLSIYAAYAASHLRARRATPPA